MKFFGEQWMATGYSNLLNNKSIYILLQNDFFYVPRWHLANCWYSHLLSWGGWHADVTLCKTCEGPWCCKVSNSHIWHWRLYLDAALSRRNRWALHENLKRQQETCPQSRCREEANWARVSWWYQDQQILSCITGASRVYRMRFCQWICL